MTQDQPDNETLHKGMQDAIKSLYYRSETDHGYDMMFWVENVETRLLALEDAIKGDNKT